MAANAVQLSAIDGGPGRGERAGGGAVAEERREAQDRKVADELAEQHLPAPDRVAQEQEHGAALHLADDGIVRDQERDQRQQKDREAGEADDDDVERAHPDAAGRRAAEEGQSQGERGEKERGGEHPAVPQALLDLLAGDDQDVPHGAASSERRKCA